MKLEVLRRTWTSLVGAALSACASLTAYRPCWAEVAASERLPVATSITSWVWTVLVPVLLFLVSFFAAYALYRHFSSK